MSVIQNTTRGNVRFKAKRPRSQEKIRMPTCRRKSKSRWARMVNQDPGALFTNLIDTIWMTVINSTNAQEVGSASSVESLVTSTEIVL